VYAPRSGELPEEREMVFGVLAGPGGESFWSKGSAPLDFYDAKGVVVTALERLGVSPRLERGTDTLLHPGRTARVTVNGSLVGVIGELHPQTVEAFDLPTPMVACFELDLARLLVELPTPRYSYRPFSRFPVADRDLALMVDEGVSAEQLQTIIEEQALVRRAVLFDLFTGGVLPSGKKSLAYRVELQSSRGTLTAEQLNDAMSAVVRRLERETGASLRT